MVTHRKQLEERLWAAAEQLRANGSLKLNEISNANYLWMQMFASALSSQGRAGFVMANSASDAGNAEKEMSDVDFEARMKELMSEFTTLTKESHVLEQKIMEDWNKIL